MKIEEVKKKKDPDLSTLPDDIRKTVEKIGNVHNISKQGKTYFVAVNYQDLDAKQLKILTKNKKFVGVTFEFDLMFKV